jgi:putative ABC transport system permease protein
MYGVISCTVAQRTQEIGIRVALGAGQGKVFRRVLGQGARLASTGIGLGIVTALGVTLLMASFLHDIAATGLKTFASSLSCQLASRS